MQALVAITILLLVPLALQHNLTVRAAAAKESTQRHYRRVMLMMLTDRAPLRQ
jgi:hypothetical protein